MAIWHRMHYAPAMTSADLRAVLVDEAIRSGYMAKLDPVDHDAVDLTMIIPMLLKKLPRVRMDWTVVEFSPENIKVIGEKVTTCGVPYVMILAGGDWETPVACAIYFDGQELRGYVPEDGNSYNHMTKSAFGNFKDDRAACERQYRVTIGHREDMRTLKPDMALVEWDVATWVKARGEHARQDATTIPETDDEPV